MSNRLRSGRLADATNIKFACGVLNTCIGNSPRVVTNSDVTVLRTRLEFVKEL